MEGVRIVVELPDGGRLSFLVSPDQVSEAARRGQPLLVSPNELDVAGAGFAEGAASL